MGRGDGIGKMFFPQQSPCHPGIYTQFGRPDSSDRARKDQKAFLGISQYLAVPGIAISAICTLQSYEHLVLGEVDTRAGGAAAVGDWLETVCSHWQVS